MGDKQSFSTVWLSEESQQAVVRQHRHGASLVVYHRSGVLAIPLGGDEPLIVGREAPADIVIDDPSLSRRHACFTRRDGVVWIEDLGSTNGTRLRGQRITETSPVAAGDELILGSVLVALYDHEMKSVSGLITHDALLGVLDRELLRAKHYGRCFSVLMARVRDRGQRDASASTGRQHYGHWVDGVRSALRPFDSVAIYSPEALEILLPEAGVEEAMNIARAMVDGVARDMFLAVGVATYPLTATTTDQVLEGCRQAVLRATPHEPVVCAAAESTRLAALPEQGTGPVVESAVMRKLFETVDRVARSPIPVLLHGETGTGKEVITRALVDRGPRRGAPLVCVNCGAIPPQLVESTLFGHEKGAFTGASHENAGVFLSAAGGTVLLDEIGELPAAAQAALLRVLEAKVVTRVGSSREIPVDVRVIAATHRNLEVMIDEGSFRRDLLYRLNALTLEIPPLRERSEEIPSLVQRFLHDANEANGFAIAGVEADALALLANYHWPGNLRELRNAIERAVVIAQGDTIGVEDLPERVRAAAQMQPGGAAPSTRRGAEEGAGASGASTSAPPSDDPDLDFGARIKRYEADLIIDALRIAGHNQTEAAKHLRMPLRTLVHKIKTLGIKRRGFEVDE